MGAGVICTSAAQLSGPYPARVRFLTRLLIWWRWPMAVVAALLLVAILPSGWYLLWFKIPMFPDGGGMIFRGSISVSSAPGGFVGADPIELIFAVLNDGPAWRWWDFSSGGVLIGSTTRNLGTAPLWAVALPPLSLALLGSIAKRRQPKPGQCKACRHPLVGAAICPECGRAAS